MIEQIANRGREHHNEDEGEKATARFLLYLQCHNAIDCTALHELLDI